MRRVLNSPTCSSAALHAIQRHKVSAPHSARLSNAPAVPLRCMLSNGTKVPGGLERGCPRLASPPRPPSSGGACGFW
eukprot:scaffold21382_cov20-Tisochrysis_lutea.AAC.1